MPLTHIDAVPALVLIDLQKGIVNRPTAHPAMEIVNRAAQLAQAFRRRKFPVVLVNVEGSAPGRTQTAWPRGQLPADWIELVPELSPAQDDILISKRNWGAMIRTGLHDILQKKGVTQIFIGGISTSIGVESTAREAFGLGYNVVLIQDAMTDLSADNHRHTVEQIFPRLGELTPTMDLLQRLEQPPVIS